MLDVLLPVVSLLSTSNFSLPKSIGVVSINYEIELKKVESYLLEFYEND